MKVLQTDTGEHFGPPQECFLVAGPWSVCVSSCPTKGGHLRENRLAGSGFLDAVPLSPQGIGLIVRQKHLHLQISKSYIYIHYTVASSPTPYTHPPIHFMSSLDYLQYLTQHD